MVDLQEYLNTPYDPDVEFVDGVLVECHRGDWLHSMIQSNVLFALRQKYPHLKVVAELRSSVTPHTLSFAGCLCVAGRAQDQIPA